MLVEMPPAPIPAEIQWAIDQPSQSNRSEITGRRRVTLLGAAPRWKAKVQMPTIVGERNIEAWRAFAVDLDGVANSFRLLAAKGDQILGVAPKVVGGGQAGFALQTTGWGDAGTKLRRGQFVTINDQLLMLMKPVIADDAGAALIEFKPYIRFAPLDQAKIEARRPYALMSSTSTENGWIDKLCDTHGFSIDCEESF